MRRANTTCLHLSSILFSFRILKVFGTVLSSARPEFLGRRPNANAYVCANRGSPAVVDAAWEAKLTILTACLFKCTGRFVDGVMCNQDGKMINKEDDNVVLLSLISAPNPPPPHPSVRKLSNIGAMHCTNCPFLTYLFCYIQLNFRCIKTVFISHIFLCRQLNISRHHSLFQTADFKELIHANYCCRGSVVRYFIWSANLLAI